MNRQTTKGSGHSIKATKRPKPKDELRGAHLMTAALNAWLFNRGLMSANELKFTRRGL